MGSQAPQSPIIYLIRHGEKPPKLPNGQDPDGLSTQGVQRSQALVQVFGSSSPYILGYIIAQHPKDDGKEDRPYLTIKPLADSLKPNVEFFHKVHRDDAAGVAQAAQAFQGPGNILICWEHHRLQGIAQAIGVQDAPVYPEDRFDVIWTIESPYDRISNITSEHCPGLDDAHASDP
ncbi:hypothetical protein EDD36DRAFT_422518 [Exophiala viscosa]|uniref:Phosphoglycerate mutase family protein n=1 Tax=Exophiala viscosa TaxID=2486360 RepID=A0AAN6DRN3_9EURO|nr:hypothetical protein EDD36DRAFT_422518 [Exophiala viscosa]